MLSLKRKDDVDDRSVNLLGSASINPPRTRYMNILVRPAYAERYEDTTKWNPVLLSSFTVKLPLWSVILLCMKPYNLRHRIDNENAAYLFDSMDLSVFFLWAKKYGGRAPRENVIQIEVRALDVIVTAAS
ncbi:hypothetical protein PQX77_013451 [Marasmius sp. AFHP31]|nr:hypothetical protein PQX77_013451 [Marasmius sp. AFHP31]